MAFFSAVDVEGMHIALAQARLALEKSEVPVGCALISRDGSLSAVGHNQTNATLNVCAHITGSVCLRRSACKARIDSAFGILHIPRASLQATRHCEFVAIEALLASATTAAKRAHLISAHPAASCPPTSSGSDFSALAYIVADILRGTTLLVRIVERVHFSIAYT